VTDKTWPWPSGAATGAGSLPGTDIDEALRVVLGELPDLPHLPELPARGPGADLIGRGAALLTELPVELYAARWRMAARPGGDLRAARDYLERDLDTLTAQASEYAGALKIQAVGPWTLAATLDLPIGGVVLRDGGAARDLADSLADGRRAHVAEVRGRVPGAEVLLQLDEPALPTVLAGRVPTESGLGTLRAVDGAVVRASLARVIEAVGVPVVVHCCAADAPVGLIHEAGAAGIGLDLGRIGDLDVLGAAMDAGLGLLAGAVDTAALAASATTIRPADLAARVLRLWQTIPRERLPAQVVVGTGPAASPPAQPRPAPPSPPPRRRPPPHRRSPVSEHHGAASPGTERSEGGALGAVSAANSE
jgi:hypothetical protein